MAIIECPSHSDTIFGFTLRVSSSVAHVCLSRMSAGVSHDKITRFLASDRMDSRNQERGLSKDAFGLQGQSTEVPLRSLG